MQDAYGFIVMETNTGAVDGWYSRIESAKSSQKLFKEKYPKGQWVILKNAVKFEFGRLGHTWHNEPHMEKMLEVLK